MQIQPIDFLGQMQSGDLSLMKPLQLGVNIGLNAPTKLEQERQRADIDYQKEHTSLLQQQIAASQQDKELAKKKFDLEQSASQRIMDVFMNPDSTLADIDSANNAIMYLKPEIAAKIQAMRAAREDRINQFEQNTFAKLFSSKDDPELLRSRIDEALVAAKKEGIPDLYNELSKLKAAADGNISNPLIINSIKSGLSFYPKGRDFLKDEEAARLARLKAEGKEIEELSPKEFAETQNKFSAQVKPKVDEWNTVATYRNAALQAGPNVAGDMALARAYIKSLTPHESVMGDDMAQIAGNNSNFANLLARIDAKITQDGTLTPKSRLEIKSEIEKLAKAKQRDFLKYQKEMEPTLLKAKLKPSDVFAGIVDLVDAPKQGEDRKPYKGKGTPDSEAVLPTGQEETLLGEPSLIPPMPEGAVRLKRK